MKHPHGTGGKGDGDRSNNKTYRDNAEKVEYGKLKPSKVWEKPKKTKEIRDAGI